MGLVGGKGMVLDSVKAPLVLSVQKHNFLFVYDAVLSGKNRHACPHFNIPRNSPFSFALHTEHYHSFFVFRLCFVLIERLRGCHLWPISGRNHGKKNFKFSTIPFTLQISVTVTVTSILQQDSNPVLPCMQVMSLRFYHA